MKRIPFRCLALLLLWSVGLYCQAASVRIQILNSKNGEPLQKQQIAVSFLYDASGRIPTGYPAIMHLETDVNGNAQLSLPEPAPQHIGITVHLTSEHWHCVCLALAETQNVIQEGVIVGRVGSQLRIRGQIVKAKPGEVLFLARPFTFLERLLYPLVKG